MSMTKRALGQYFTIHNKWLMPQVKEFIVKSKAQIAYDPFAGNGDLLKMASLYGIKKTQGLDIDPNMEWDVNDSLENVPRVPNSIIITNPPYLTNYSAKRKNIYSYVQKYFEKHPFIDLYQLAISKCLDASEYVVAILPESYITNLIFSERVNSITILESNPFDDTENPVCVVCFDSTIKTNRKISIYKNDKFISTFAHLERFRPQSLRTSKIVFNARDGQIALRAVDTTNPHKKIEFMKVSELAYDLSKIKQSSRLITVIKVMPHDMEIDNVISHSNSILNEYRENTSDVLLTAFKGNNHVNQRRRRLDYRTARAILELAILRQKGSYNEQFRLFQSKPDVQRANS